MNRSVVLELYLLNLGFVTSLSLFFFKKSGTWNLPRFFSLLPFLLAAMYLILLFFGVDFPGIRLWSARSGLLEAMSVPISVGSFILTAYALGSHRGPVSLCHQREKPPDYLIVSGAYAKIRHPFYTAHLSILLGIFVFHPNLFTLLVLLDGCAMLTYTAIKEEKRFLASPLGSQYEEYMKKTGRFLPRW